MSKPSDGEASRDASLLDRLRTQLGEDVDPGITLGPISSVEERDPSGVNPAAQSSGVLSRLGTRTPLATRYRLDGEIARGGMGAILDVWDEDLRRHLAMKVALGAGGEGSSAKAGELDARILARFLEEAQVTGQLEHPGIVPVHELGLDENGHLYFTMPLVRGRDLEHIFELVAERREDWSITRALGVLLKACEAMAYAHAKGVIHRDLKPANVMVGKFGEVYVMDWGLARVRGHEDRHDLRFSNEEPNSEQRVDTDRRTDATGETSDALYTMDGDVIGTPAYMAPEQARGELDALDERTDVYSLGAMMYRLLAKTQPYTRRGERALASDILTSLLEGPPVSVELLAPEIPLELVAICDKAMSREPENRYADMSDLANDLRAFLENRVVRAYRTGAVAETIKWVRRNKPLAVSLAAGIVALTGGLVVSLSLKAESDKNYALAEERRVQAVQSAQFAEDKSQEAITSRALAVEQRLEAVASAEEARRQTRVTAEINEFFNTNILASAWVREKGKDVTLRQVLAEAAVALQFRFRDEPEVEGELRLSIAFSFAQLGDHEAALVHALRAREIFTEHVDLKRDLFIRSMRAVASGYLETGKLDQAAETFKETLALSSERFGSEDSRTVTFMNDLALVYHKLSRYDESRQLYEEILGINGESLSQSEGSRLATMDNYGTLLWELGELSEAEELLTTALELSRKKFKNEHQLTIRAINNLALVLSDQGRLRESEKLQREAVKLQSKVFGEDHPDTALGIGNLGALYLLQGRYRKAERMLEDALERMRAALGNEHSKVLQIAHNLATCQSKLGKYEEAEKLHKETLEALRRTLGTSNPQTLESMNGLAALYRDVSRYDEAEALLRETLELQTELLGAEHPSTLSTLENIGFVLFRIADYEQSESITRRVLEARTRVVGPNHPDVAKTIYNLGMLKKFRGDSEGAVEKFELALIKSRAALGNQHPNVADILRQLADLAVDRRDYEYSIEHYREATEIRRSLGPDDREIGYLLHQTAYCLFKSGNFEAAIEVAAGGVELRIRLHGEDDGGTLVTKYLLAAALIGAEHFDEAEPIAIDFYERKLASNGPDHPDTIKGRELLQKIDAGK